MSLSQTGPFTGAFDSKTVGRRFMGKIAIITGSSEGIGYGIAYRLAQEGAHVVINGRRNELVNEAVEKIKSAGLAASGMAGDIVQASDRKALIEHALKCGGRNKIDTLVNNVGIFKGLTLLEASSSDWDALMDVNIKSSWLLTKEAHSYIPPGGSVLFISSAMGYSYRPGARGSLYAITKTLTFGVTQALSKELAPKGIRVNTLSPGPILTPLISGLQKQSKVEIKRLEDLTTLKRLGTLEEIGAAAAFLCSDDAGFITGEGITAAGGEYGSRL